MLNSYKRLTVFNPLARRKDSVENILLLRAVLHWWQLALALRGSERLLKGVARVRGGSNFDGRVVQHKTLSGPAFLHFFSVAL